MKVKRPCIKCGTEVGNDCFTVCDKCWDNDSLTKQRDQLKAEVERLTNINQAGKQQRAQRTSCAICVLKWQKDSGVLNKTYSHELCIERGHAAGWIAGVAWAKRQRKGATK